MNERKIGAILSYLNILIQAIVGFLYVPILLYYMGKSEYGLYQLMGSLIAYFSVMDFGLTSSTIRSYIHYKTQGNIDKLENFLAMTQRIYIVICIFIIFIASIVYIFLDNIFNNSLNQQEIIQAKNIFILLMFNLIITFLGMVYRSVITANEKFLFIKGIETLQLIFQPFMVIAVMQISPTAMAMVCVMTIINIVLTVVRMIYCYKKINLKMKYQYWDTVAFKEMKSLALSVFIVTVVDQIFWKTNQIVLGIISGTVAVAIYSIASLIYMNYMALSTAIAGVYLPKITQLVAKNSSENILFDEFLRIGRLQYYILAFVYSSFYIFGKEFIILWTNDSFVDAYYITLIIILPFTIDLIQNVAGIIMKAKNIYGYRAKIYLLIGIINMFLSIILAKYYGAIGCAVACGTSIFLSNVIMNLYYKKYLRLDIKKFWIQIARISLFIIICIFTGSILDYLLNYLFELSIKLLAVKIIIYTLLFFIIMWYTSFNFYEKNICIKLKRKIFQ